MEKSDTLLTSSYGLLIFLRFDSYDEGCSDSTSGKPTSEPSCSREKEGSVNWKAIEGDEFEGPDTAVVSVEAEEDAEAGSRLKCVSSKVIVVGC